MPNGADPSLVRAFFAPHLMHSTLHDIDPYANAVFSHRYHAMLEVECCSQPHSALQKLQHMYRTHAAIGREELPQSFILDTTLTRPSSSTDDEERRRSDMIVTRLEGKRNLSVVERQQLWLAQKNVKVSNAKKAIARQREEELASSAPDLTQSRKSFQSLKENREPNRTQLGNATAARKQPTTENSRQPSNVAANRKRPMTGQNARSLTNAEEPKRRVKRRKMAPISDPFVKMR